MQEVKISIVIPVYNVEKYVEDCLKSVLNQPLKDIEVICVNDGSTDGSLQILEKYEKQDQRVTVITQSNQGLSSARNTGLERAVGQYIWFVDSDDMISEDALQRMYEKATSEKVDVLCFNTSVIYEDEKLEKYNNKTEYFIRKSEYSGVKTGKQMFTEMMEKDDFIVAAWLVLVNRKWMKEKKIWFVPGILYEDSIFCMECYMQADRIYYMKNNNYVYRVRQNSIMNQKYSVHSLYCYVYIFKYILVYLLTHQLEAEQMQQLVRYAERYLNISLYVNNMLPCEERNNLDNTDVLFDLLLQCMQVGRYSAPMISKKVYLEGLNSYLEHAERIIIYGAGKIGKMTLEYIRKKGYLNKVFCFAVTDISKNSTSYGGIPIRSFETVKNSKTVLFILSAKREFLNEMVQILKKENIDNYVAIDLELELLIKEYLAEQITELK